ncbi:uncharacterized protein LOC111085030 isoform X2 [Limulus polyphemus]|uniref:Uncharacterized protein LOC111085030 isoform X2 n=1 Tax=Limulus polyphemus TaxID=6850 RepID=A0ABM1S258_LIMPO|nr:uncharacterized protein LOC111085030 isoform X2 [Limulus polyphemus]
MESFWNVLALKGLQPVTLKGISGPDLFEPLRRPGDMYIDYKTRISWLVAATGPWFLRKSFVKILVHSLVGEGVIISKDATARTWDI